MPTMDSLGLMGDPDEPTRPEEVLDPEELAAYYEFHGVQWWKKHR